MTPLPSEYAAVSRHITEKSSIIHEGAAYEIGRFPAGTAKYQIIIREPGMKNAPMAVATERAIRHFEPQIAILCGIAGGIKDVRIGDVAVAKSAFDYDSGKESADGFLPRPNEYVFSDELLAHAQLTQRSDEWKGRTVDGAPDAQVHIASVAAGDKVISAVKNSTFQQIQQFLSHCKFLEMEAAGFGLAIQRYRHIHAIVVRGISDMCYNKTKVDQQNFQDIAADRAAAVVFELLSRFDNYPLKQDIKNPLTENDLPKEVKAILIEKIQIGIVESAIEDLVHYANTDYRFIQKQITSIAAGWKDLEKKRMMGIISFENYNLSKNQLLVALIELLS